MRRSALLTFFFSMFGAFLVWGQQPAADQEPPDPYAGELYVDKGDARKAMQGMQTPDGIKLDLWAAEPMLANPVAFCFDEKGRVFVAETFRVKRGVSDNRDHDADPSWLDEDLLVKTVAERLTIYKKHEKANKGKYPMEWYTKDQDRVRLLEDTKGIGHADKSVIYAGGFNQAEDGLGSGVLAKGNKVWYTNIPNLWLLEDTKGTGHADVKTSLAKEFGVRTSILGHDLHGLRFGPDGKIYFSVGDRGANITTKEGKQLINVESGSVFRCYPDGTELEIVHTGLRNPQELAFDDHGNLFTGDNNADGGDRARWVYIVEGGDSGWRLGYQYMSQYGPKDPYRSPPKLGAWSDERVWHTIADNSARYVLPPFDYTPGGGPSGLAHYPGTGQIPETYKDAFFLCDFHGGTNNSQIYAVSFKPQGATFAVDQSQKFVSGTVVTDCDFGPDGAFYFSDWVATYAQQMKGRIYKAFDPSRSNDAATAEVKKLLAEGFGKRPAAELVRLLESKDQRVRLEAQYALADLHAVSELEEAAKKGGELARLHAIWGLGQVGHKDAKALTLLPTLLKDNNEEVRAQAAKILGEGKVASAMPGLIAALKDSQARVRFFSAMALGKIGAAEALPAIIDYLRANADADPYERHAAVMALAWIGDKTAITRAATDTSESVRLGSLLAMRRLRMSEVSRFLNDASPQLVLEAARAINDVPIPEAMPALAALATRPPFAAKQSGPAPTAEMADWVMRRALDAQNFLGQRENARALATVAASANVNEAMRIEALAYLLEWENPSIRDHVVGLARPKNSRPRQDVVEAARTLLPKMLAIPSSPVKAGGMKGGFKGGQALTAAQLSVRLAANLGMSDLGPALTAIVNDISQPAAARVDSLRALIDLKDSGALDVAKAALLDSEPLLRIEARRIALKQASPAEAVAALAPVLTNGQIIERQAALGQLGDIDDPAATKALAAQLQLLLDNKAAKEIRLDILEAVRRHPEANRDLLARYDATFPKTDKLAPYREAMAGGDAESGRRVFFEKSEVTCVKCHKAQGIGGDAGPDLTGLNKRGDREYILESIVEPNAKIAKGFESVVLELNSGQVKTGILKGEDAKEVRLMDINGLTLTVPVTEIAGRRSGPSPMPEDIKTKLTQRELRDLVEFLAGL